MTVLEEVCSPNGLAPDESARTKVHETLVLYGQRYVLDADRKALDVRITPVPTWIYQIEGIEIEKRLIAHGAEPASIEYELFAVDHDPLPECHLEVRIGVSNVRRFDLSRCTRAVVLLPTGCR